MAQSLDEIPTSYVIQFEAADVQDWDEFETFITNITQAESIELNENKNEYTVSTFRVLDPKIIEGKLFKFGVDYYELKQIGN